MERFSIEYRKSRREKACGQVVIGLSFAHVWLREWREFSELITERS